MDASRQPEEFHMLICSDFPEADITRLVWKLEGKEVAVGKLKVVLRFHSEEAFRSRTGGRQLDLLILTGRNLREADVRRLAARYPYQIAYCLNCLHCSASLEDRKYSQRALASVGRALNLHFRTSPCKENVPLVVERDITNLLHLLKSQEAPVYREFLQRRYLDALANLDELALIFGEERCLKKSSESLPHGFEAFPVSLARCRLPSRVYEEMRAINRTQNQLWMQMSYDTPFLLATVAGLERSDDFVARFTHIIRKAQLSPRSQVKLCISRNDFILSNQNTPLQVEFNLIASGMGPMTQRHHRALDRVDELLCDRPPYSAAEDPLLTADGGQFLFRAFKAAHDCYGNKDAIVVMVCGAEKNVFDQFAAAGLLAQAGIGFVRYSFQDLRVLLKVDETTGVSTVLGREVALFYFRDGYVPQQYEADDWAVRERIELSKAVKCPDASLQLINMKYFQYVINQRDTWSRFGFTEKEFRASLGSFCGIWTIDDFALDKLKMREFVISRGGFGRFVLKPQREGGANNLFNAQIQAAFEELSAEELRAYILMEKIDAKTHTNIHCDWKELKVRDSIDEIGLFHFNLWKDGCELSQAAGGSLVRTKLSEFEEGGVSMGYAVINSLDLTES